MSIDRPPNLQRGLSLIELVMFIVIVSAALAGVLAVLNVTVRGSGDPMTRKQMLAIAEAIMEEVQAKPFTYCDPNDANAASAVSADLLAGGCATTVESPGPETSEVRVSNATPFNNVNDYYVDPATGYVLAERIPDITNTTLAPAGYSARIDVAAEPLNGITSTLCTPNCNAMNVLRIKVTVNYANDSLILEGYRTRFAPNSLP